MLDQATPAVRPSVVLYTAVTGGVVDHLQPAPPPSTGQYDLRCVCFTNDPRLSLPPGWTRHSLVWEHENPRRESRWHKLHSVELFPDADWTLWVDGTHGLKVPIETVLLGVDKAFPVHSFKHPYRNCVYQELQACLKLRKDDPQVMTDQVERYRKLGLPPRAGLLETACMLRMRCVKTYLFERYWWQEMVNGSVRDQLSVTWALREAGLSVRDCADLPGARDKSPWFTYRPRNAKAVIMR